VRPGAEDVLVVLAHQDDEIGILARIAYETARGARVWCAFLTDGASKVAAAVRDAESLAVLARVGVPPERVGFVGAPRVPDGSLFAHLERALEALRGWAAAIPQVARVYTLDWEGGHHDHDAAHLVALSFARERAIADVYTYSLYNAWRRPRRFFRVTSFVPQAGEILRRRLTLNEALLPVRAIAAYPSQRSTWLGLGPGLAVRAVLGREERLRRAQPERLRERPHPGALLYETLFGVASADVMRATASVRDRLSGPDRR
jgi:LmbE family N-acetylglucosaminyl deacetylase